LLFSYPIVGPLARSKSQSTSERINHFILGVRHHRCVYQITYTVDVQSKHIYLYC